MYIFRDVPSLNNIVSSLELYGGPQVTLWNGVISLTCFIS